MTENINDICAFRMEMDECAQQFKGYGECSVSWVQLMGHMWGSRLHKRRNGYLSTGSNHSLWRYKSVMSIPISKIDKHTKKHAKWLLHMIFIQDYAMVEWEHIALWYLIKNSWGPFYQIAGVPTAKRGSLKNKATCFVVKYVLLVC